MYNYWSPKADAALKRMIEAGESYTGCIAALTLLCGWKLTRSAVAGRVLRLRQRGVIAGGLQQKKPAPKAIMRLRRKPAAAPAAPTPQLPQPEQVKDNNGNALDTLSIRGNQCRYALRGEGRELEYCGSQVAADGGSWCAFHRAVVFRPAQEGQSKNEGRIHNDSLVIFDISGHSRNLVTQDRNPPPPRQRKRRHQGAARLRSSEW